MESSSSKESGDIHPRSHRFELFAEGGGNTWGLDFDATGNAFGSSNGAYITFHMVQGGYYFKGFAKHGPLHNPHTYGYFGPIAYEGTKQGGHVTPGGIIYKGDAFPREFRGAFIGGNLLSNAVYWHNLTLDGSTFAGRHGGTLIDARDRWFRPIDVLVGPGRGRLCGRLVRQTGRPSRPARHLGPHQRPNLSRRLRRAPQGAPL